MELWKFVRQGQRSPFTDYSWTPGVWNRSPATLACGRGFHACRVRDLPYWLGEELWRVELSGDVTELTHKVVAREARLVERVSGWDRAAGRDFALTCTRRVMAHAAAALAGCGLIHESDLVRAAVADARPARWRDVVEECGVAADRAAAASAVRMCDYVRDAVDVLESCPVASSAYVAARVADEQVVDGGVDGYTVERRWQARWLAARLGLDDGGADR